MYVCMYVCMYCMLAPKLFVCMYYVDMSFPQMRQCIIVCMYVCILYYRKIGSVSGMYVVGGLRWRISSSSAWAFYLHVEWWPPHSAALHRSSAPGCPPWSPWTPLTELGWSYIHTYIHIHTHTYIHKYIHTYKHSIINTYLHTLADIDKCVL